jgi:hypothetical protein
MLDNECMMKIYTALLNVNTGELDRYSSIQDFSKEHIPYTDYKTENIFDKSKED